MQTLTDSRAHFFRDSLRPISWLYVLSLLLLAVFALGVYKFTGREFNASLVRGQLVFALIVFCFAVFRLGRGGLTNILAPDTCFLGMYAAVFFGYIVFYTLGLAEFWEETFYFPQAASKSMLAINLGAVAFLLGVEAPGILLRHGKLASKARPAMIPSQGWEYTGAFFIALGLVMHFAGLMLLGFGTIARYGYAVIQTPGAYGVDSFLTVNLLAYNTKVIALGIVIYCLSSAMRHRRLIASLPVMMLIIMAFVLMILEGDRGPILLFGLPMLLIRHFFVKPIKLRYLALLMFLVALLSVAIAVSRDRIVFSPSQMMQEYSYRSDRAEATWYSVFLELGRSYNTINITTEVVPSSEPYWRGMSWVDSVTHVVPFAQGRLKAVGFGREAPSDWLTITFWGKDRAGRAFSVVAEGYLNFGFTGVVIELFAIGFFLRWLFVQFCLAPSAARGLVMLGCFGLVVLVVRNHLNLLITPCVHIMIFAWLLSRLLGTDWRIARVGIAR